MRHKTYDAGILEGSGFHVELDEYAKTDRRGAARLLRRLRAFAKGGAHLAEHVRGNGNMSIVVIPPRRETGREAALLALVDERNDTVRPIRLLSPDERSNTLQSRDRWKEYELWAERTLKI